MREGREGDKGRGEMRERGGMGQWREDGNIEKAGGQKGGRRAVRKWRHRRRRRPITGSIARAMDSTCRPRRTRRIQAINCPPPLPPSALRAVPIKPPNNTARGCLPPTAIQQLGTESCGHLRSGSVGGSRPGQLVDMCARRATQSTSLGLHTTMTKSRHVVTGF